LFLNVLILYVSWQYFSRIVNVLFCIRTCSIDVCEWLHSLFDAILSPHRIIGQSMTYSVCILKAKAVIVASFIIAVHFVSFLDLVLDNQ
jgi:hypothetical protein